MVGHARDYRKEQVRVHKLAHVEAPKSAAQLTQSKGVSKQKNDILSDQLEIANGYKEKDKDLWLPLVALLT